MRLEYPGPPGEFCRQPEQREVVNNMTMDIEMSENALTTGRNGMYEIRALQILHSESAGVFLDCISRKRGVRLNAGIILSEKDMDSLAKKWIQYRLNL